MEQPQHLLPDLTNGAAANQQQPTIGLMSLATYLPEQIQDAAYIAEQSGIAEDIVRYKLGICQKRRAGVSDQSSTMAVKAARLALERANVDPLALDLIL